MRRSRNRRFPFPFTALAIFVVSAMFLASYFVGRRPRPVGYNRISPAKSLALALIMYQNDYDNRFPPISEPSSVLLLLTHYNRGPAFEIGDAPPEPFENFFFNPYAAGVDESRIPDPEATPADFDSPVNGTRAAGYVDGHAKIVKDSDWPAAQKEMSAPLISVNLGKGRRLGEDLSGYVNKHQALPSARSQSEMRAAMKKQFPDDDYLWSLDDPKGATLFFNLALSGKSGEQLFQVWNGGSERVPLLYASQPDSQNKRVVCFSDGNVELVDSKKWRALTPEIR